MRVCMCWEIAEKKCTAASDCVVVVVVATIINIIILCCARTNFTSTLGRLHEDGNPLLLLLLHLSVRVNEKLCLNSHYHFSGGHFSSSSSSSFDGFVVSSFSSCVNCLNCTVSRGMDI